MDNIFSDRVKEMEGSFIREILKVTERPGVISFAGGLPAPELFPVDDIRQSIDRVLSSEGATSLQYSTTEGYPPLRRHIANSAAARGIKAEQDDVLITNGSQQALDLLAKIFINPGDTVIVENPSYLGAIQVFRSYQAKFEAVAADAEGIDVEALEKAIIKAKPRLIYLSPTFNNPTGATMSPGRRAAVASLLEKYRVPLIEDDPYGELYYGGEAVRPLKSYDRCGRVLYLSTFSKTISPGLRMGWIIAGPEIMQKLVVAKQGTDLHTGTLIQRAVYDYLANCDVESHIGRIRTEYGHRKDVMVRAMENMFPQGIGWTNPQGGMFLWVTLPPRCNTTEMLKEAIAEKVAYVPGFPFYAVNPAHNNMRLNFSNSPQEKIEAGMERLSRLLNKNLHK